MPEDVTIIYDTGRRETTIRTPDEVFTAPEPAGEAAARDTGAFYVLVGFTVRVVVR
jgi:hypothetical protein